MSTPSSASSYASYQVVEPGNPDVRTHLLPYFRRWPWYLFSLGLALALAFVYLLFKQPLYRTQASVMLPDEKRGSSQASPLKELDTYSPQKVIENELEVLRSTTLMRRVVERLHLDVRYFHSTRFGKREVYAGVPVQVLVEKGSPALYRQRLELDFPTSREVRLNGRTYPLQQRIQTPYGTLRILARRPVGPQTEPLLVQVMPVASAANQYRDRLKVEPTSKTSTIVQLTLEDPSPQKGEAILGQLIQEYNAATASDKTKLATNTLRFVEDRLRGVAGELASVERNVQRYKSAQGITDLGTQAQTFLTTAQQNDAQLSQVNIKLAVLNDLQQFVSTRAGKRGGTPATVGLDDPVLLGQIEKLSQLELQRDNLSETTSEQNPLLQSIDTQIKATRQNIGQNIQTMRTMLTSSQQQFQAKNQQLEGLIRSIPQQERTLMDITRQQAIKNNLYNYLLQKREEMAVSFASALADTRTVDAPQSSDGPVKPVGLVVYALFGLVGFLIPTGLIAGRSMLNTRVARRDDVEEITQAPILGEVMHRRHRDVLVIGPHNRSVLAEQIRIIRTNLQAARPASAGSQVVLFTSSISGEGKSFLSLNLGASLAMLKRPTVILEMDLRMPRLHQSFDLDTSRGITSYLNGEADLHEILQPVPGYPNYYIIPSGPLPADPSELLNEPRLQHLFDELRAQFRYVIVDAPPIGIVTDAQVIAPLVDSTLFVVRHGVTPKQSLKILDTLHREQRFPNLSVILNSVGGSESYHFNSRYKNSYAYK
jgi:capsular exopolysaccharide synthesis family protein